MTLDEAIKHAEEVADFLKYNASRYDMNDSFESYMACQDEKCAAEHRQLAEWLKELKRHREAWVKAKQTVKAYLMLEGFGSAYQDDIENLIEGCIPKEADAE